MAKILVVEDDPEISKQIVEWLKQHDFHALESVADGKDAVFMMSNYHFDIIILDWELPGLSGPEICKQYRAKGGSSPILMLTGKVSLDNKEEGFLAGVDDYLTKPFSLREVSMRVQALLRRPQVMSQDKLAFADLDLNTLTHEVFKNSVLLDLAPKEFALLELFMRHPGQTFSPDSLLSMLWKTESESGIDTVRTTIKNLRKKISSDSDDSIIRTVHRVGYKLDESPR